MPALVPTPNGDTPEAANYAKHLRAGLDQTLAAQREAHRDATERAQAAADQLALTRRHVEQLQRDLLAAETHRDELPRNARGHRIGGPAADQEVLRNKRELGEADLTIGALDAEREFAKRQATLAEGSLRPLHLRQTSRTDQKAGPAKFGVYAFYDFEGVPLYVGKTTEGVGTRVRRHLSNQRTDAVAMSVLDPMEVAEVEVWPVWADLSKSQAAEQDRARAGDYVSALEWVVAEHLATARHPLFNEKNIPEPADKVDIPASVRFELYDAEFRQALGHPDIRIARRAAISSRLAAKITERSLRNVGLRRSLQRQLARLTELADARFTSLGGEAKVGVVSRTGGDADNADEVG